MCHCFVCFRLFKGSSRVGRQFGPRCYTGDKIGCGIRFDQMIDDAGGGGGGGREDGAPPHHQQKDILPVFFTKNGKELGRVSFKLK